MLGRTLVENGGGAGGFHDGLAWAIERGADLVWLMDDDGLPDPGLPRRRSWSRPTSTSGARWSSTRPTRAGWSSRSGCPAAPGSCTRWPTSSGPPRDGRIDDIVIPFNGVLVTRELVERIGLPRAEFFIWGDDHEYRLRAEAAGARIATVVGAQVRHPSVGDLGTPMMFGRTTYNHSPSDLKHYCMARNNLLNLRDYRGWPHALAFVAKTLWFYTLHPAVSPAGSGSASAHGAAAAARRLHRAPEVRRMRETVAVVVVTYNRADLLARMLAGLAALERLPGRGDRGRQRQHRPHRRRARRRRPTPGSQVIRPEDNLGGAGGFHLGVRAAYERGFDRIWLMDDDVVPAPGLPRRADGPGRGLPDRGPRGHHRAAWSRRPRSASTCATRWRSSPRPRWSRRRTAPAPRCRSGSRSRTSPSRASWSAGGVVDAIGLPDPSFFIFYDDVDYAVRARRAGFRIWAVRDAVLVRQLDFDQQHDLSGWKGYYMYRNLFVVHLRYGENALVRLKPWLITAAVVLLSPVRGGRAEARNVIRAMRDARGMRVVPVPIRRLTNCVNPRRPVCPPLHPAPSAAQTSSSSAPASSVSRSRSAAPPSSA